MAATDKALKTTVGGTLVPQVFDVSLNDWVPTTGTNGVPDVRVAPYAVTTATLQSAAVATGNGTSLDVSGMGTATLNVSGTFVATVVFEVSQNDTDWTAISGSTPTGVAGTSVTAPGQYAFAVAGYKSLRARVSAWTSGSVTVAGRAIPLAASGGGGGGGGGGAVTVADGVDVTQGAKADPAASDSTSAWSVIALLKGLYAKLAGTLAVGGAVSVSNLPATQPVSGTVTANAGSGTLNVSQASAGVTTTTLQSAVGATGNGTTLDVSGMGTAVLNVSGTFVATVTFEVSTDDAAWVSISGTSPAGAPATTATAIGQFAFNVAGYKSLRARVSAWTSGTVTVVGRATALTASTGGGGGASGAITVADGADVAQGAKADAPATTGDTTPWSQVALLKALRNLLAGSQGTTTTTAPSQAVLIGGKNGASIQALTVDSVQNLLVSIRDATGSAVLVSLPSDALPGRQALTSFSQGMMFNEASWDRQRANTDVTVLASAARTATVSSPDQTLYNGRGVAVTIDVTSITSTPSITVAVEVKDVASGKYTTVLTSVAITAVGTTRLRVYPGLTATANVVANDTMGRTWRVTLTHANANSITYSVGAVSLL